MPEDPYSDPVTGVLHNKLGLGTAAGLEAAEREITHAALILLDESPVSPSYDLPHLQEIHKRIFGDIYEWPGRSGRWPSPRALCSACRGTSIRPRPSSSVSCTTRTACAACAATAAVWHDLAVTAFRLGRR